MKGKGCFNRVNVAVNKKPVPSNFLYGKLCINLVEKVIQVHQIRGRIG